ncbi:hypothetical protein MTO96_030682 [Rhipicephalus appendiculatus]
MRRFLNPLSPYNYHCYRSALPVQCKSGHHTAVREAVSRVAAKDKVYTSAEVWEKDFGQKSREPAGKQQHLASGDPPGELHNVAGNVSKCLMLYGFVDLEPPHRVSVFFDKRFFDGNRRYDLTKSWLKVGDRVLLDAVRSPPGYRAKYQATCIETVKKMEQNPAPSRTPSERDGGMIYGCPGTIQAVNSGHGFILFGKDNEHCTYFVIARMWTSACSSLARS